jgi:rhodanese-related sulfurtransferase
LNVSLRSRFAEFAGDVLRPGQPIALLCDPGQELEAKVRLGRIGFDTVAGFLAEPLRTLANHPETAEPSSRLTAAELAARLEKSEDTVVIDVRNPGEVAAGMIDGAINSPLPQLLDIIVDTMGGVDRGRPVVVYCAGGTRSSIAASVLSAAGHPDVSDLLGGYEAWRALTRRHAP